MDLNSSIRYLYQLPYVASITHWLLFGLIAGVSAKIIIPGQENLGWIRTIGVGILGALLGGFLAAYLGYNVKIGWNFIGFLASVSGAVVLILLNRVVTRS
jgi:uncharacterized membrane protein YeaQ/YmgE (transglycosylase-associated protein family)